MSPIVVREPVSAATHALGLIAAFPVTWLLIRETIRQPRPEPPDPVFRSGKIAALGVFGFGMAACYGASTAYHAFPGDRETVALLRRLDMVGIFLLIAGTFTPAAWALMRPGPRRLSLSVVWGVSAVSALAVGLGKAFPTWLATTIYVSIGWGMLGCYLEVRRRCPRGLWLLPAGGALYTAGALVNLLRFPDLPLGIGPHEVFHLFVLAGTATHIRFLWRAVVPAVRPSASPGHPVPSSRPVVGAGATSSRRRGVEVGS